MAPATHARKVFGNAATGTVQRERTLGVDWVPKFAQGACLKPDDTAKLGHDDEQVKILQFVLAQRESQSTYAETKPQREGTMSCALAVYYQTPHLLE